MSELKIFIAGSKELKQERNGIKIIANDLSSLYGSRGIHITAHSYEHFDEDQLSYNNFIINEADIAIFILDGYIGSKTEEEFIEATKSLKENGHPEVMVFMREYDRDSITPSIARVQGLIMGCLGNGKYHTDYSSLDDLKARAKERIMRYVDKHEESLALGLGREKPKHEPRPVKESEPTASEPSGVKQRSWLVALLSAFVTAAVLLSVMFYKGIFSNEPQMFFVGGGSVAQFIKDEFRVNGNDSLDIKNYGNSIYLNMPSGTAWSMPIEEITRKLEDKKQPFVTLCLSAARVVEDDLKYDISEISNKSRLLGYKLGYDSLIVFVEKGFAVAEGLVPAESDTSRIYEMDTETLANYILNIYENKDTLRLFTTNLGSGTLRLYREALLGQDSVVDMNKIAAANDRGCYVYYQYDVKQYFWNLCSNYALVPNKPFIVLGSSHYMPRNFDSSELAKFYVKHKGIHLRKEMFVFFPAYVSETGDYCTVSEQVVKFLEDIDAGENLNPKVWQDLKKGRFAISKGLFIKYLNM